MSAKRAFTARSSEHASPPRGWAGGWRRAIRVGVAAAAAAALAGCDFEVTNPGPVQDEFLDETGAHEAIVNGMGRALADAINFVAFHGAAVARELHPTGGTGSFGLNVPLYNGRLLPSDQNTAWNNSQQARWISDDGIRRLSEVLDAAALSSSKLAAQAHLWAGYAYRLLGENMCEAVIDGGAKQQKDVYLAQAEDRFTQAIDIGGKAGDSKTVTAARAGRAAVRAFRGKWPDATSDAAAVPKTFVYQIDYHDIGDAAQFNRIHEAMRNQPYKTATVWGTPYELYYRDTEDPRIPWVDTGNKGDGGVACCGPVPFYRQMKYPRRDSDINLSSGREMRLIEAEAKLVGKDWPGAIAAINQLRGDVGVPPVSAANETEAWTLLKRERGIELWLEARRLGDFYRWDRDKTPGQRHPREVPGAESHMEAQDLCFPIPDSELETNPNLRRIG